MDLKALIAKMDVIEKKQILTEDAKPTKTSSGGTVTKTEKGSVHKAGPKGYGNKWDGETQDQAPAKASKAAKSSAEKKAAKANDIKLPPWKGNVTKHSSNKGAEKDDGTGDLEESFNFKGAIANALLKEFGLEERISIDQNGNAVGGFKPTAPEVNVSTKQTKTAAQADADYIANQGAAKSVKLSPDQQQKIGGANPQDPYIVARVLGKDAVPLSYFTNPEDQKIAKQIGFKDAAPADTNPYASANVTPDVAAGMTAANTAAPTAPADTNPYASANVTPDVAAGMTAANTAPAAGGSEQPAARPTAQPDPKIKALQQQLIAKGAKIKDDGFMGPQTQAAMKQFGGAQAGQSVNSVAQARNLRQGGSVQPGPTSVPPKTFTQDVAAKKAAAQPGGAPVKAYQPESVQQTEDNAVLNLIRNAFKR